MNIRIKLVACLVLVALLLASLMMGVAAQEESILDGIIKRGSVRVAMILTNHPLGFRNDKGEPDGYEVEIAKLLAEKLGVKLEIVEVSGPTRISALLANKADIVLAGLTRTLERAKSVAFMEIPYYMSGIRYVVRPDSPYKTVEELQAAKDKVKVGTDRGGTGSIMTAKLFPNAQVQLFEAVADQYLALTRGVVDFVSNDAKKAVVQERQFPDKYRNLPGIFGTEELGAAVAYGDFKWWHWCNLFFHEFNSMGDNSRLYQKWYEETPEQLLPWTEIKR